MEFPFRDRAGKSPLHEKVLLLEMNGTLFQKFAIGYYDAIRDVFHVWESGHLPSDGYLCGEWPVGEPYEGIWCPMPKKSSQEVGERRIKSWMEMPAALDDMKKLDVMEEDMDKVLEKSGCCQQYLVCTDDWKLTICEVSSFTGHGKGFGAFMPATVNELLYHMNSLVPKSRIRYAVNLAEWHAKSRNAMFRKKVDAERLLIRMKGNDLSYMQQEDIMRRLESIVLEQIKEEEEQDG